MREIRIYQPGSYSPGELITLSPEAAHHAGVVLRMNPGARLTLFSGDDREFETQITSVHKKNIQVSVLAVRKISRESARRIHLLQAVPKGDRMELVVQKAVELGVVSITPLITERCAVKLDNSRTEKKLAQWQAIAIAACEQSGRNVIPEIHAVMHLQDYLQKKSPHQHLVLSPQATKSWRDYIFDKQDLALLVGPEGGLSHEELLSLEEAEFAPLSLGPRILRTETAAIVALGVLQAVYGDL